MEKDVCQLCGAELTELNRSKSYRKRCKSCVAKQTAEKRAKAKEIKKASPEEIMKTIEADVIRFIRHEAMRVGVKQDQVIKVIKYMQL